jgi:hypothetical protein
MSIECHIDDLEILAALALARRGAFRYVSYRILPKIQSASILPFTLHSRNDGVKSRATTHARGCARSCHPLPSPPSSRSIDMVERNKRRLYIAYYNGSRGSKDAKTALLLSSKDSQEQTLFQAHITPRAWKLEYKSSNCTNKIGALLFLGKISRPFNSSRLYELFFNDVALDFPSSGTESSGMRKWVLSALEVPKTFFLSIVHYCPCISPVCSLFARYS